MPSPFPGMNPYLEQDDVWHDFHERFLSAAAEAIGVQVLPDHIVKIDENVYIHEHVDEPLRLLGRADVGVARVSDSGASPAPIVVIEAPMHVRLPEVDVLGESFLEIRDRKTREVVCVIELLSPSNKRRGPDREQYLSKRRRILASPTHLVEIDLLRSGEPMPWEERPPCSYSVSVSRASERPVVGFWAIGLKDPLPTVPIPLRPPYVDAQLDIRAVLDRVHDAAGYRIYIYDGSPSPPLTEDEATWARGCLTQRDA